MRQSIYTALARIGFLDTQGVYVLVDGQFGSTGKGLVAELLEQYDMANGAKVNVVGTNAAPNSGHTAILENGDKVFTQQIPVFAAARGYKVKYMKHALHEQGVAQEEIAKQVQGFARLPQVQLNGGAVIDLDILDREVREYGVVPEIHEAAALITPEVVEMFSSESLDRIASTGKGTGQAMASKILRNPTVYGKLSINEQLYPTYSGVQHYANSVVLLETAQGFSLGPNSGFYPYVTSRECTVSQALADAGAPPNDHRGTFMVIRCHPIRVGNTDKGNSGPVYHDQEELTWEQIGVKHELTSVTKRIRRVFSFSEFQFMQAFSANRPDVILLNFANYCDMNQLREITMKIKRGIDSVTPRNADVTLMYGFGPKASDVFSYDEVWNGGPSTFEAIQQRIDATRG